jgi:CPA2 family monovalent cation:H+ antiporter-2
MPYVVLELNGDTVREERARGEPILFSDVTDPGALESAGVKRALAVVAVLSDPFASTRAVAHAHGLAPHVPIFVRTRYRREAERMRTLGAIVAVAEEVEASLEVLAQLLAHLQVAGNVIEADLERLRHELPRQRPLRAPRASLESMANDVGETPVATHLLDVSDWAVGRSLVDLDLRAATGVAVLGIRTGEGYLSPPPPNRELRPGDILYLLGPAPAVSAAHAYLARAETGG